MTSAQCAVALVAFAVVGLSACGSGTSPREPGGPTCQKEPVHVVLHVDASHLWGTDLDSGGTVAVAPQSGVRWTIDPGPPPSLVDTAGRTVGSDGDIFYAACVNHATKTYVIGPKDLPNVSPGA